MAYFYFKRFLFKYLVHAGAIGYNNINFYISNQKRKSKLKPLHLWSVDDVLHWLRKHIGEGYYIAYGNTFKEHAITGVYTKSNI